VYANSTDVFIGGNDMVRFICKTPFEKSSKAKRFDANKHRSGKNGVSIVTLRFERRKVLLESTVFVMHAVDSEVISVSSISANGMRASQRFELTLFKASQLSTLIAFPIDVMLLSFTHGTVLGSRAPNSLSRIAFKSRISIWSPRYISASLVSDTKPSGGREELSDESQSGIPEETGGLKQFPEIST
jgi:hypothetical protein